MVMMMMNTELLLYSYGHYRALMGGNAQTPTWWMHMMYLTDMSEPRIFE